MKTKVLLQLFLTLVLGFVLGFLSHGYVTSQKIKNYSWGRGEAQFWNRALQEIEASQEQIETIMPIVKQYSEKGHQIMSDNFKRVEPLWDEMNEEIKPLLSVDQQKKLKKLKEERSRKFRERAIKPGSRGRGDHKHNPPKPKEVEE